MSARVTLSDTLSDRMPGRVATRMQAVRLGLVLAAVPVVNPQPPAAAPEPGSWGYMLREVPITGDLPALTRVAGYLRDAMLQSRHCDIDMQGRFEAHRQKFSSKTRSTITRKIKKFTEQCGCKLKWSCHRTPAEIEAFFPHALALSTRTHQERLLDDGMPTTDTFRARMLAEAAADRVRAFLLFHGDKPVSYLFCSVEQDALVYAYLGCDLDYKNASVGAVLQWLALGQLFGEARFRCFDFTEGESDHKRLFATHAQRCASLLFARTVRGRALVHGHRLFVRGPEWLGAVLDSRSLKRSIRRLIRFGARAQAAS